jgi:hypothetical protein
MQPKQLSLRYDQIGHRAIDHRVRRLPASVAQIEGGLAGVAVADENGLFAVVVFKLAEVLIPAEVIDVGWCARRGRVVIAYVKERNVISVGRAHNGPRSLSCRLTDGWIPATS